MFSSSGRTFSLSTPDRRIAAVPYALQAARVQGYAGVVVVAKSGGDFTQIQPAVDSISDAREDRPYLVWVAPGLYEESVTLKPYVHLQGAGREATVIESTASSSGDPPTQATVVLADESSVRDLTGKNGGSGSRNVALLLPQDFEQAEIINVTAEASGAALGNYAIYVDGVASRLTASNTYASAAGNGSNYGLYCDANATLFGGRFRGQSGTNAIGVYHAGSELVAEGVEFSARDGADNYALYNAGWLARVHGGHVDAKGGGDTWGILNTNGGNLQASDIAVYSEGSLLVAAPSTEVRGLENKNGSTAVLKGGTYKAYGGQTSTAAFYNSGAGTTLEAYDVTADGGAGGSYDLVYGLYTGGGASAVLRGGSYLARGGQRTRGIMSEVSGSSIDAHGITAESRDGTSENYALYVNVGAAADIRSAALVADIALRTYRGIVNVALSQTAGLVDRTAGSLACYGVYDSAYTEVTCP